MFIHLFIYIIFLIDIFLADSDSYLTVTSYIKNITVQKKKEINPEIDFSYYTYIYFEIKPNNENNLYNITFYYNHINTGIRARYLNQKKPLIYLNTNVTTNFNYMQIQCSLECDFTLFYQEVSNPFLYDSYNFSINYMDKLPNTKINYKSNITDLNSNNILINVMGKSIENFPISFFYNNKEIKCEKNFINGKGLLITKDSGIEYDGSKNFSINYTPLKNDSITISSRIIKLEGNNVPTTEIELFSETYVVLNKNFTKECFSVKSDIKDVIYLNAFSKQGINVYHVNSNNYIEVLKEKKIINSDYFLFNLSLSNVICFNLIDDNFPSTTVNFQIFLQDKIMDNNDLLTPILRGVEYKFFLKNSTMIYHRLASLNKNEKYNSSYSTSFYFKLILLQGKIEFYKGTCESFPNCTINKETLTAENNYYYKLQLIPNAIEEGINVGDANFNHSIYNYSIIYFSKYQILPTVKCINENNEEDCEYIIQVMNKLDDLRYTQVSYGKNIYKNYDSDSYNSKICYAFTVDDENINSIKIELNSLQGNSDLKSFSDSELKNTIGNYYSLGNKEYIIINKSADKENLINQYYYCISSVTSSYYISKVILKSNSNSDDYITEGETEINSINFEENSKKFIVTKQNISNPYYIFVKALNCKLNISYNNNTSKYTQFFDNETSEESELMIKLDSLDSGRNNSNENCIFYTGVSDIEKPIEINEGISYDLTLLKDFKKMKFKYDFFLNKTKLLLFIDKYNTGTLKITVRSKNSKEYYLTDFNNFKAIDINVTDITQGNNLSHCVIFIDIENIDKNKANETDINYSLEIFYSEKSPYYLPTGELILDIMELYGTQYFYTDIKRGKYAEIVINCKTHPFTTLYGKIIKKNETDTSSDWNNYVKLPTTNSLTFDYYNRKFIINENDTDGCDDNYGCELYIGFKNSQSSGIFLDYSIFLRYDDTIVKVPNDEYLFGSLEINKEEKQYDYYSYTVTKNIKKFYIIFDTELCEMYINEGNEKPSNDPSKHKYKINSDVHSFEISSESSLINKVYTIAVTPKDLDQYYKSFYRFKIVEQSNEQIIYFIESQSEEFCEIKNDGGNCLYILRYNPKNKIYNIYARNLLYMETNNINIKAKIVNAIDFELNNDKLSYFNEDNFVYNNTLNGYLYFTIDTIDEDQFILIKLTSEHKGKISLISQFYPTNSPDYLNPNYYKIFTYDSRSDRIIRFEGNDTYSFRFQIINGSKLNITQNNTNSKIELNQEEQNNIALVERIIGKSFYSNTFKFNSDYIYYTIIGKYIQRTLNINFDIIEFGNPNYFIYNSSYDNIFPIIFYLPVVQSKKNVTIYINITNDISSIDDLNIDVYGILTDSVSVMKAKRNLDIDFKIGANSECEFVHEENYAVFKFNAEDIDNFKVDEQKYFYIKLNTSNDVYNLPNISLVVDTELHEEKISSSSSENGKISSSSSENGKISSSSSENGKISSSSSENGKKSSSSSENGKKSSSSENGKKSSSSSENEYSSSSNEDDTLNNKIDIETKSYFKHILKNNEINTFLIKFLESETSKMKLEISFPTNEFSISFRASNNSSELSPLIKNFEKVDLYEKIIYIISGLFNFNGLVVQLKPNNNNNNRNFRKIDENNSDLFIVKYKEYKGNEEIIYNQYYFENNSISYYSNDNNYIWSVEQIKSNNSNNNYDIKYILNLYDSETYSSFSILDLIGFGIPIQNFSNFTLNDSSNKVIFNINKNDISNKVSNYNITIIANVTNNNTDYELLSAKPISFKLNFKNNEINYKDESSDDNNKNKNTVIIVCLVLLFVIIITVIIIIFYKLNLKKTNSTDNHEKFHNEGNDHNNLHTEQQYININEKPDIKNIEMKGIEHPVDILE